jgi:hypothetical protein
LADGDGRKIWPVDYRWAKRIANRKDKGGRKAKKGQFGNNAA